MIKRIYELSLLSGYLHKLLVVLILHNYRFKICLPLLVVPCQFYLGQVSGSIFKTDLSKSTWKKSDLSNANSVVTQDPTDHDSDHPKV